MSNIEEIKRDMREHKDSSEIELSYPWVEGQIKHFIIGLSCVRAADSIRVSYDFERVSYDFERDGLKIEQASIFEWEIEDDVCDPDWQEVAFIQVWARQIKPAPER